MLPSFVQIEQSEFETMMPVERNHLTNPLPKHASYHSCAEIEVSNHHIVSEMNV